MRESAILSAPSRHPTRAIGLAAAGASACCLLQTTLQFDGMFELEGLDHVALAVRDVEHSANWYVDVLGFERRYQGMWNGVPAFVARGKTALALFPGGNDSASPSQRRETRGMLHLALRADRGNFAAAQRGLLSRGIPFHFQDHEISLSIYFRDPDGIELEITTYELE